MAHDPQEALEQKKKILVIDDEEDFLKITKLNLEKTEKYRVMTLASGKDVLSVVHSFLPDVILVDLLMPELGGLEICEILNQDPVGKRVPVIVLSALNKDVDKYKAFKVGVVDYLVKPIEKNALIEKLEKALQFK